MGVLNISFLNISSVSIGWLIFDAVEATANGKISMPSKCCWNVSTSGSYSFDKCEIETPDGIDFFGKFTLFNQSAEINWGYWEF